MLGGGVVTTYAHREVVVRRVEYGAAAGENIGVYNRVKAIAWHDWCRRNNYDPNDTEYDDWCTVHPRDEETVFAFSVEHPTDQAEQAIGLVREAYADLLFKATTGTVTREDLEPLRRALDGAP